MRIGDSNFPAFWPTNLNQDLYDLNVDITTNSEPQVEGGEPQVTINISGCDFCSQTCITQKGCSGHITCRAE